MRRLSIVIGVLGLAATFGAVPASAQQAGTTGSDGGHFEVRPGLTADQFEAFTSELGSLLRFRQVGDATTLGNGRAELSAQFSNVPFEDSKGVWTTVHHLGRSISYPQVVARYGVSDRVDLGAWGGLDPGANYGFAGFDTRIALLRQSDGHPVSVLVRPSIASLIYPSEVLVGTVSVDVSVSRAVGPLSPYGGIGGSSTAAVERSATVNLDAATANHSYAFGGLSYRWRSLVLSGEVEKGARVNYAFRIGTRF
jgi:hypothetical protein